MHDLGSLEEVVGSAELPSLAERVLVSPRSGRFIPLPPETFTTDGEWVHEGQVVAQIESGDAIVPVVSAFAGWMMGMLAIPGQPVTAGDPLFWVRP